jgi:hypothetical protein
MSWELRHGAAWLLPDGTVLAVPGFHEAWIEAHRDLVGECRNVCEVVLAKDWISVALFSGGYVELMVPDRRDPAVRSRIARLLRGGLVGPEPVWRKALVLAMDEEGYAMLEPADLEDDEALARVLAGTSGPDAGSAGTVTAEGSEKGRGGGAMAGGAA